MAHTPRDHEDHDSDELDRRHERGAEQPKPPQQESKDKVEQDAEVEDRFEATDN
jgi:hypothetical protein